MKFYTGNVNELVETLENELIGMKGRRNVKNYTENLIQDITGLEDTFSAYRDTYHHYHIPVHEDGGGHSIFVSFNSQGKVNRVSKM